MARRKTAAAEAIQTNSAEASEPQETATATAVAEPARDDLQPGALLLPDPFRFKTVNVDGVKLHFQHSRQAREFQIQFGDGGKQDMPSDNVREFIKSHKTQIQTADGPAEVNLFHWNDHDRAWGMHIPSDRAASFEENRAAKETARQTAKGVFDKVVELVREERGAGRER